MAGEMERRDGPDRAPAGRGLGRARNAGEVDAVIRRVRPSDQQPLAELYARLSPESRRARFLGTTPALTDTQSLSFCTPDHQHGEGFVALVGDELVGHLCLEPCAEDCLELAVAVADEWQARGIGRLLFESALGWARQHGCTRILATAYADNLRVLRLLMSAPQPVELRGPDAGVVTAVIPTQSLLPQPWRRVPLRPRAGRAGTGAATAPCRVVWRRRRPPGRAAAG